jgi:hypothetical protein
MDNGERGVRSSGVAMKHPVPSAGSLAQASGFLVSPGQQTDLTH